MLTTHSDESAAPRNDRQRLHVVAGGRLHDVRREPTGGFAGPIPPDAPVRDFGNRRHVRREGNGTFFGDADRQREGTFADSDAEAIVGDDDGARAA